jgi:endonuclease YncB( thermonuclease family)
MENNNIIEEKSVLNEPILESATSDINEFSLNGLCLNGKVVYVYDGDTVHLVFKLDNKLVKFNSRLVGVDSPEMVPKNILNEEVKNQEKDLAYKSRDYLINRISNIPIIKNKMTKNEVKKFLAKSTKLVFVKCYEFDKYGRLLVELFEDSTSLKSINQELIDEKHALSYDGGTKQEFNKDNFNENLL